MQAWNILISLHTPSNIGYAIAPLEKTFYEMALRLTENNSDRVHFSYQNLDNGMPESLPAEFENVIAMRTKNPTEEELSFVKEYISKNNIKVVFGFDLPVGLPIYRVMRQAGVKHIISYYGAPLSSINSGIKLLLKRIQVTLSNKPDHFILESEAMRKTAVYGRGIRARNTSVVNLGVDTEKFQPYDSLKGYAYEVFGIPSDRKILLYSGHMEKRKGVDTIIDAVTYLANERHRNNFHMLLLGNKNGDEERFYSVFQGTPAEKHITFGGYRNDLNKIMASCYIGIIASNGWDSFPRSSIEMGASGLPLIVANFQGLIETIDDGATGKSFRVNDHIDLVDKIVTFLDDEDLRNRFSISARNRALKDFTLEVQLNNLLRVVSPVIA